MVKKTQEPVKTFWYNQAVMYRNRMLYLLFTGLVIFSGLLARKIAYQLPGLLNLYLGDALWALMVFLITGFFLTRVPTLQIALMALCFCFLIEISQLYHADWIDAIRQTRLGALILGFGFLWSDLLAYTLGITAGCVFEKLFLQKNNRKFSDKTS